jgi:uncharacterized protein (TIGR02246 family)
MKHHAIFCLLAHAFINTALASDTSSAEIDRQVWSEIRRTVIDADIDGMAATYHPDAVLVSQARTLPVADQLIKWGQDMEAAMAQGSRATVEFRFSSRQDDSATAFEQGLFKYTAIPAEGPEVSSYVEFETLMVKTDGKWLILMERQLMEVDEAAWTALAQ